MVKQLNDCDEATADIRHQFVAPDPMFQSRRRFSPSEVNAGVKLAWYRGHQAGVHDAYKAIRRAYPEAARAILEKFDMSRDGSMPLRAPGRLRGRSP